MSEDEAVDLFDLATSRWSEVCGIHLRRVDKPGDANIVAYMSRLSSGILGLAQLSFNESCNGRLWCKLQKTAIWTGGPEGSLVEVDGHELGHNLGWDHYNGKSIMTSQALGVYTSPTTYDIAKAVRTYGPDKMVAEPEPPPVDPIPEDPSDPLEVVSGIGISRNGKNLGHRNVYIDSTGSIPPTLGD